MLKTAVVGVGHLGRFHAEKYKLLQGIDLVGVVDVIPERADEIASRLGVKAFYDHRELPGLVEAVSVVVPTSEHYSVTRTFLEAGVHVLLEKPITPSLEEADDLIGLADRNRLVLQIGHLERFNPAFLAVSYLSDRPVFIEAHRVNPFPQRGTDVDVVLDLMIHDLDIVLYLIQEKPVSVSAVGLPVVTPLVDIANARLEFPGGCVANLNASRIAVKTSRKFRIFQRDTFLSIDFGQRQAFVSRAKAGCNNPPEITAEEIDVPLHDALEYEIRSFIDAVTTPIEPLVTGQDGRRALELALRINRQINERRQGCK